MKCKQKLDEVGLTEQTASQGIRNKIINYNSLVNGIEELKNSLDEPTLDDNARFEEGGKMTDGGMMAKDGGVDNYVFIALSKTKNGLLLSERFDKQITHKELFDYYKKRGYEITDSNIFKVTNKGVLDIFKDAISKFVEEKYNELVDWENSFLSYDIVSDRIIAQSSFVQTKNGNEYKITPNDLVNKKFNVGGGVDNDARFQERGKMADGGMTLSNNEIMQNIEFEDDTDIKFGRYNFSFDTIDSEGARILDYDGYIIVQPASSRQDDEIEWGQNVPEDYSKSEDILIEAFYDWKNKKMVSGGVTSDEIAPKKVYLSIEEFDKDLEDSLTIITEPTQRNPYYVCQYVSPALYKSIVHIYITK